MSNPKIVSYENQTNPRFYAGYRPDKSTKFRI